MVCSTTKEGGLGFKSLLELNNSMLGKSVYKMIMGHGFVFEFLRERFYKAGKLRKFKGASFVWSSMKQIYEDILKYIFHSLNNNSLGFAIDQVLTLKFGCDTACHGNSFALIKVSTLKERYFTF